MGIDSPPDVEESTDLPIRACTEPTSHANQTKLSFEPCDTEEEHSTPCQPHVCPIITSECATPGLEDQLNNAHRWDPSEIASLLQSDLQYVTPQDFFYIMTSD